MEICSTCAFRGFKDLIVRIYCIHGLKVEERARCTICNSAFKAGGRALNLTHIAVAIKCLQYRSCMLDQGNEGIPLTGRGCFSDEDICWGAVHLRNSKRDLPHLFNHQWSELSFISFSIIPIHGNRASSRTKRQICFSCGVRETSGTHLSRLLV